MKLPPEFFRKRVQKRLYSVLKDFCAFYFGLMAILFIFQRDLLYRPFGDYAPPTLPGVEELTLTDQDGTRIKAWFHPAPEGAKTIVFFHGNGGNLTNYARIHQKFIDAGFGFLAITYRGYPGSEGRATEMGIYQDARAAMEYLHDVPPEKRVIMGLSLGTGVAVQMATEYPASLLVLASPFTSVSDVAGGIYWYLPVHLLVRDPFDSFDKINRIKMPVYIFHSTDDPVVPYVLGKKLYDEAKGQKRLFTLEGEGHSPKFSFILQQIKENP